MYALKGGAKEERWGLVQGFVERTIPPFLYRYLFSQRGRSGVSFQRRALLVTNPMTWEEFCYKWAPLYFPEVSKDLETDPFPTSYRKACIAILSHVLEISESTAENIITYQSCKNGLLPQYGQLLRKTHMLWSISNHITFSVGFLRTIS